MKNLKTFLMCACLLTAVSISALAQEKSLYERLGGEKAISAVVDDFAGRVLADTRINKKFVDSDPTRLVNNLKTFMCMATGGGCKYEGLSMKASHKNMGVTGGEFGALVEDLVATLDKFKVPEKEKNELLGALGGMKGDIVEVKSDATGTPLPKKFKPAPAMGSKEDMKAKAKMEKKSKKKDN
ncbi:MAG: group 1 truncated hemoglobin [Acidobacteriota bacterium]|nr:group 1 truncated hemoglobin [Acidobacteriota bacterium]